MDYVEWCELVLRTMGIAGDESAQVRNYGIDKTPSLSGSGESVIRR